MNERTADDAQAATRLPGARDRSYTPPDSAQGGAMTGVEAERRAARARSSREPLARADRIQIAMLAGLFAMFAGVFGAGAVGFTTLSGQILGLQKQVGDLRTEMHKEIGDLRTEMHKEIGDLRTEMQKEIGKLSDRMTRVEERMTSVETLIQTHLVPRSAGPPAAGP